jgi:A1 cistron-splicing factor AAR2
MGETSKLVGGVSLQQAQEAIAVASATGGAVKRMPSQAHKPEVRDLPSKPLATEISQLCTRAFDLSPSSASSLSAVSENRSVPSLVPSESMSSVGPLSTRSHVSVPVTGSVPYGELRILGPTDTLQSTDIVDSKIDPIAKVSPSPPLAPCLDLGDAFVILDLPEQSTIGLDSLTLTTGKDSQFRGFRDVSNGPHLLWVSEPQALTRCGYWFVTGDPKMVRVKQWDRFNETLGETASHFELREQRDSIESTYPKLIPYKLPGQQSTQAPDAADAAFLWQRLTSSVSPRLLDRISGKKAVPEWLFDTTDTAKGELHFQQQPDKATSTVVGGTELSFLFSPDVVDMQLLNLANMHDYSTDTTSQIISTLDKEASELSDADLVGELQFTFLTGLHLGNGSCIEQWWHLVLKTIMRAHQLAVSRPVLCRALLETLLAQMIYNDLHIAQGVSSSQDHQTPKNSPDTDGTILEVMPQNKEKLRQALIIYKRRLNEALLGLDGDITPEQAAVGHAFADLEAWFWKYGWDLRSDYVKETLSDGAVHSEEDELPVVVELDQDGREIGLF